jgi:hypothetical protein
MEKTRELHHTLYYGQGLSITMEELISQLGGVFGYLGAVFTATARGSDDWESTWDITHAEAAWMYRLISTVFSALSQNYSLQGERSNNIDKLKQQPSQHSMKRVIGSPFYSEDEEAAYLFNQAHDKITEVQQRLQFLYDSAPMSSTASSFCSDGLRGMSWVVGDMVDSLWEAKALLQKLTEYGKRLEAEHDQHGPTSFSMEA